VEWWCREIIAGRLRAEAMLNAQLGEEKGRQVAINELMGQITFYRQRQDNRSLDEQQREVARAMVPILEEMLAHKLAPPQLMDTKTHSPAAKTTSAGAVVTSAEQRRALEVFDQGLHKAVLQHPRARTMDELRGTAKQKQRELSLLVQRARNGVGAYVTDQDLKRRMKQLIGIEREIEMQRAKLEGDLRVRVSTTPEDVSRMGPFVEALDLMEDRRIDIAQKFAQQGSKVSAAEERNMAELAQLERQRQGLGRDTDQQSKEVSEALRNYMVRRNEWSKARSLSTLRRIKENPGSVSTKELNDILRDRLQRAREMQLFDGGDSDKLDDYLELLEIKRKREQRH